LVPSRRSFSSFIVNQRLTVFKLPGPFLSSQLALTPPIFDHFASPLIGSSKPRQGRAGDSAANRLAAPPDHAPDRPSQFDILDPETHPRADHESRSGHDPGSRLRDPPDETTSYDFTQEASSSDFATAEGDDRKEEMDHHRDRSDHTAEGSHLPESERSVTPAQETDDQHTQQDWE